MKFEKILSDRRVEVALLCRVFHYSYKLPDYATILFLIDLMTPFVLWLLHFQRCPSWLKRIQRFFEYNASMMDKIANQMIEPFNLIARSLFHCRRNFDAFTSNACPDSCRGKSKHSQESQIILSGNFLMLASRVSFIETHQQKHTSKTLNSYQWNEQTTAESVRQVVALYSSDKALSFLKVTSNTAIGVLNSAAASTYTIRISQ